jgi:hypothetical protein
MSRAPDRLPRSFEVGMKEIPFYRGFTKQWTRLSKKLLLISVLSCFSPDLLRLLVLNLNENSEKDGKSLSADTHLDFQAEPGILPDQGIEKTNTRIRERDASAELLSVLSRILELDTFLEKELMNMSRWSTGSRTQNLWDRIKA